MIGLPAVLATEQLLSLASHLYSGIFSAQSRGNEYDSNRTFERSSPPPDTIIKAYWAGKYGDPESEQAWRAMLATLEEHGIYRSHSDDQWIERRGIAWDNYLKLSRPLLPLDFYLRAWRFGKISNNGTSETVDEHVLNRRLKRDGVYDDLQQYILKYMPEPLTEQTIFRLWSAGIIEPDDVRRLLRYLGQSDSKQLDWLMQLFEVPNLVESLTLRNREVIDDEELDNYLGRNGFRREQERQRLAGLRFEIPGPSELVRFAVRHFFEPSLVARFGFKDEISQDFIDWHKKQGFGQQFDVTDPPDVLEHGQRPMTVSTNWAEANWISHWVWAAPTQMYRMLQRLRPGRVDDSLKFDSSDLYYGLRGNDYPPFFRKRLAAISFRVIEPAQIRELRNTGFIDDAETIERFQDAGYTRDDAILQTDLIARENEWRQIQRMFGRVRFKTMAAYREGIISRDTAAVQLYKLSLSTLDAYNIYKTKPEAEQIQIATVDAVTNATLDMIDTDLEVALSKTAIDSIRKAYLHFEINESQTLQALLTIGVTPTRANEYVLKWGWQHYGRGKTLAVGQITKQIVRGILLPEVAVQRLVLLGYTLSDAYALVTMASQDRDSYVNRAASVLARNRAAQQRALVSQANLLKKQLRETVAALARSASRAKLVKWATDGLIPESEFRLRLSLLGVSPEDIQHEWQEILRKRASGTSSKKASKAGTTATVP